MPAETQVERPSYSTYHKHSDYIYRVQLFNLKMHYQYLLLAGASIFSSAVAHPEHPFKRDLKECSSVAKKIDSDITRTPQPPASVATIISQLTITDECVFPEVTGEGAAGYSAYVTQMVSWYGDLKETYDDIIKACNDVPEISRQIALVTAGASTCDEIHWASPTGPVVEVQKGKNGANSNSFKTGGVIAVCAVAGAMLAL